MPILPTASRPVVDVDDRSFAVANRSALDPASVMDPTAQGYPYNYYESAIQVLNVAASSDYSKGALAGYRTLTGSDPDLAILVAIDKMGKARETRNNNWTFGAGALDIWRLLVDEKHQRRVDSVIKDQ